MAKVTDPISDLLTRIRNGQMARHAQVSIPGSKLKFEITKILAQTGYVESTQWVDEGPQGQIRVKLRYDSNNKPIIRSIKRVSKPSRRIYVGVDEIPEVLNGLGISILSTSRGLLTDRQARAANVGGELLCSVY
jgi:small subunit ribosomal protein S8